MIGRTGRATVAAVAALALVSGVWLLTGRAGEPAPGSADPYASLASESCVPPVLPAGQAYPGGEPEPLLPVWCYELAEMPTTRLTGPNSWLDEFDTHLDMGHLADGDMDYRVFSDMEHHGTRQAAVFLNQDHWMVDTADGSNGGVLVRPDRSFRFEDGKLVVEADAAAALPEYGDSGSVEIDITTAPEPTGRVVDEQYGYGLFGGHWTFGCRFQADRQMTCALFNASGTPGDPAVFGNELGRVWQTLPFQPIGRVASGGSPDAVPEHAFRQCAANEMDLFCRDRFRLELTKDSVKVFVNGRPYFEQSGIDPANQLPDEFLNADLYVYYTSWINRPLETAYRFHWDRLAVNPRDAAGVALPPSAAPSIGVRSSHSAH
jgi:hypothetical protein